MYLETLQVSQFRNIIQASLEFGSGFNVFYGDNAQGKSNLLEAIYMMAYLKGFRGAHLSELIMQEASGAQLAATLNREGAVTRLGVELSGRQRKVQLDRSQCQRLSDYLGVLRAILFVPSDVGLLQAAPAERRTFLDRMVFNFQPLYLQNLDLYNKNQKLKASELRQDEPNEGMLDVYDMALEQYGREIIRSRYLFFKALAPHLASSFSAIFDDHFTCYPAYTCASGGTHRFTPEGEGYELEALLEGYSRKIHSSRSVELVRHQACSGPHRDDWTFILNGRESRYLASQGQQRSMILALKMAEIACVKAEMGVEPVFLLDDISSELDPTRNDRLARHLYSLTTQTFLTTTSKNHFKLPQGSRVFHVQDGTFIQDA